MNVASHCSNTQPELIDHLDQQIIEFNRSRDLDNTALPPPFSGSNQAATLIQNKL